MMLKKEGPGNPNTLPITPNQGILKQTGNFHAIVEWLSGAMVVLVAEAQFCQS